LGILNLDSLILRRLRFLYLNLLVNDWYGHRMKNCVGVGARIRNFACFYCWNKFFGRRRRLRRKGTRKGGVWTVFGVWVVVGIAQVGDDRFEVRRIVSDLWVGERVMIYG